MWNWWTVDWCGTVCPKSQLLGGTGMRQEKGSVPVVHSMCLVLAAGEVECLYHSQTCYVGGVHVSFTHNSQAGLGGKK